MFVLGVMLIRTAVSVPEHWVYYQIHHLLHRTPIFPADDKHICCSRCLYFQPAHEEECGVCGTDLFNRRPRSIRISLCFLIAAAILYLPANLLPIMISSNPINLEISTILSGIQYMWNDGDRLIAAIIFSASIVVPTLKILSMAVLLASTRISMPMHRQDVAALPRHRMDRPLVDDRYFRDHFIDERLPHPDGARVQPCLRLDLFLFGGFADHAVRPLLTPVCYGIKPPANKPLTMIERL